MTITARHAARRVNKIQPVIDQVAKTIEATVDAIRQSIEDERSGRPSAEDVGIRGINWISNPTADAALTNVALGVTSRSALQLEKLEADLSAFVEAALRLAGHCERWTYSGDQRDLQPDQRCSGGKGYGVEDWVRPDCDRTVAYYRRDDGSRSPREDGLCDACRMRRHRWQQRHDEVA